MKNENINCNCMDSKTKHEQDVFAMKKLLLKKKWESTNKVFFKI